MCRENKAKKIHSESRDILTDEDDDALVLLAIKKSGEELLQTQTGSSPSVGASTSTVSTEASSSALSTFPVASFVFKHNIDNTI